MNKNILLIGTGFIAKNIFEQKNQSKNNIERIISVSRDNYFNFSDKHITTDFSDIKTILSIIKKERINIIYFMAGPSFPSKSFNNIINDINDCLIPFIELLKKIDELSIKEFVMLSSAGTIYGSRTEKYFQEEDVIMQQNAYGVLLKSLENYLLLFANKYNFKYKILRLSNVFGVHHKNDENGLINISIRNALKNLPVKIFSSAVSKNYIFSKDVGKIFWIINSINDSLILNISSDLNLNNLEIGRKIKLALPSLKIEIVDTHLNYDTTPPLLNNSKLLSLINLEFTSFEKAINETIAWEKSNLI